MNTPLYLLFSHPFLTVYYYGIFGESVFEFGIHGKIFLFKIFRFSFTFYFILFYQDYNFKI